MLVILVCFIGRKANEDRFYKSAENNLSNYRIAELNDNQNLPTVERYNLLYKNEKFNDDDYVMFGADDITFTPEFDKLVDSIFRENPNIDIVYPEDGIHHGALPTHPIFRQSFLKKTGEFFPSGYMRHCFVDNYVLALGRKLENIKYCPELIIEHHHPLINKGRWDKYYLKVYKKDYINEDNRLFQICLQEHLPKIIYKLKN